MEAWQAVPDMSTFAQLLQSRLSDCGGGGVRFENRGPLGSEVGTAGQCGLFLSAVGDEVWVSPPTLGGL